MGEINTSYNSDTDRNGYGKEDLPGSAYSKQNFKKNKKKQERRHKIALTKPLIIR